MAWLNPLKPVGFFGYVVLGSVCLLSSLSLAADLPEIKQNGVIRHLGIPYANFPEFFAQKK